MKIITNNKPRPLYHWWALSDADQAGALELYTGEPEDLPQERFFHYKGALWRLGEFMRLSKGGELETLGWEGVATISNTAACVIKVQQEDETVICGVVL